MNKTEMLQRDYYQRTASLYDEMHLHTDEEHNIALKYISGFIDLFKMESILDVGCGTGRGVNYLLKKHPHIQINGIEPVEALLRIAKEHSIPATTLAVASGKALPFRDQSFDATCELGVLHHIAEPNQVVSEMIRISRKAIFLSDENRFAHGSTISRWMKLALWNFGIFRPAYFIKTLGKGYRWSNEDGLAYSYSVFDSLKMLSDWADRIIVVPTDCGKSKGKFHPLMTSFHVLLCAFREH